MDTHFLLFVPMLCMMCCVVANPQPALGPPDSSASTGSRKTSSAADSNDVLVTNSADEANLLSIVTKNTKAVSDTEMLTYREEAVFYTSIKDDDDNPNKASMESANDDIPLSASSEGPSTITATQRTGMSPVTDTPTTDSHNIKRNEGVPSISPDLTTSNINSQVNEGASPTTAPSTDKVNSTKENESVPPSIDLPTSESTMVKNQEDAPVVPITSDVNDRSTNGPAAGKEQKLRGDRRPHIVMIVADDLGWNDVDWRDKTMHTPVLSSLASQGVVLNHSYVQPVCSPTRAAFMTGYYPYHLGMQHDSLRATQKAHLPDNITTLPQHLQKLGYSTHMAGKWHLGFCNWRYTPTYRGFNSFVGFYNAVQDYYTHTGHRHGYDFRFNKDVFYTANGTYSAYIFTRYIEHVIAKHDISTPLFVYLPFQSVHGPLQVPQYYVDRYCSNIQNATRRVHCGMVAALDEGVGNVTKALEKRGILDDTLIFFTTDNGGPVHKGSNNWPLRGSKETLWEGGTRAMAFLRGPKVLGRSGTTYDGVIHAVDWLPTLVEAAGGPAVTGLDGVSQWQSLLHDKVPSARTEFVYNIDELKKNAALRQGKYKLLQGDPGHLSGWYPPPQLPQLVRKHHVDSLAGADGTINMRMEEDINLLQLLLNHIMSGKASMLSDLFWDSGLKMSNFSEEHLIVLLRERFGSVEQEIEEEEIIVQVMSEYDVMGNNYQLFDLEADPNEYTDVKDKYPEVFKQMRARLDQYRQSLVPANFPPHDPASYPSNFNGTWSPGWC